MTLLTARRVQIGSVVKPIGNPFHFLVVDMLPPNIVVCARPDTPDWVTKEANLQVVKQPRPWKDRKRGHANR